MIPKNIFFIWLGDNVPTFSNFAFENFKKINPEFKMEFLHYKTKDIDEIYFNKKILNEYDKDLYNSISETLEYPEYSLDHNLYKMVRKISNYFRYYLLNKYGGIYLDCDTFPIKPFDEELLNNKAFTCCNFPNRPDCFFMGSIREYKIFKCKEEKCKLLKYNNLKGILTSDLRKKFFNCTLKYGEHYENPKDHYIDHYLDRRWLRDINEGYNIIPKIKLDKIYHDKYK